jgi:hypothetical protein
MLLQHHQAVRRHGAYDRARAAAEATGILPLDYMLAVMRDTTAAMAMAAAPYLHARLSIIDAKLEPAIAEPLSERPLVQVEFVVPGAGHARGDNE